MLLIVVFYGVSLLPSAWLRIAGHDYSLPFVAWAHQSLTRYAPPPILTEMAAQHLAVLLPEFLLSFLSSLVLMFSARQLTSKSISFGFSDGRTAIWIAGIVAVSWFADATIDFLDYSRGLIETTSFFRPSCGGWVSIMRTTQSFAIFMLALCLPVIVAPFFEEVMFRGFLYNACVPAWGVIAASLVSSALFSLAHWRIGMDLPIFIKYFALGSLFFAARVRFQGIGVPIAAHIAVNASYSFDGLLRCST